MPYTRLSTWRTSSKPVPKNSQEPVLFFAFRGDQLLLREGEEAHVPMAASLEDIGLTSLFQHEIGTLGDRRCVAVEVAPEVDAPEGMRFADLRGIFAMIGEDFFRVAGTAKQVVAWHATHRFCGRCGAETVSVTEELAMRCPNCGLMHHPRVSPAVIVRVEDGDRILLARSPGFPKGLYSVLAGFVEPGESMEETVRREVREEVGIEVSDIRYFDNQPWPFPNSLMVGFTARYAGGEILPQPGEIEDAGWYTANDLPQMPPRLSIARRLIDDFIQSP